MAQTAREQLMAEMQQGFWRDLAPHALRDAVFFVDRTLDLLDVGEALVNNQVKQVEGWIQKGLLRRPTREQIDTWPAGRQLLFLIVQPFVLTQETDLPDEDVPAAPEMTWEELIRYLRNRQK